MLSALASAALREVPSPTEIYGVRGQIVAVLPLIAIVAGGLMYVLCASAKPQAIGRMILLAALLALLSALGSAALHPP